MIYLDSRYADGSLYKAWDARENKQEYHIAVGRQWPQYSTAYFIYEIGRAHVLNSSH